MNTPKYPLIALPLDDKITQDFLVNISEMVDDFSKKNGTVMLKDAVEVIRKYQSNFEIGDICWIAAAMVISIMEKRIQEAKQ